MLTPKRPATTGFAPIRRVFTHRNYAWYMGTMAPALVTIWMQRVGVGWLTWELTGSPIWLGIIAAADLVPMLILGPLAGAVTDRSDPLRLQKITQWLTLAQAAVLTFLTFTGLITIWILLVLALFLGVVHTLASTARHAIVPATVPHAEVPTAVAVDSALFNASRFIGPALTGVVIPLVGVGGTFAANMLGGSIFLCGLYAMRMASPKREGRGRRNLFGDVVESFGYIRAHPGIGPLFFMAAVMSVLIRPIQDMLPGFAGDVFDAGAVGLAWLTSSMGVGAMLSATWIAMRGRVAGLTNIVLIGAVGLSFSVIGMVATGSLAIAVVFSALAGLFFTLMSTGMHALIQSSVDNTLRGRVMGAYTLVYRGLPAIGALAVGIAAEWAGLRLTFAVAAVISLGFWVFSLSRQGSMRASMEGGEPPVRRA